jgi:hypothetical protein
MFPDPIWPVVTLAVISFGDAILCIKPVKFVADCFEGMGWPRRYWPLMPPVKFAAAAGLIIGLWVPGLALITTVALVLYFVIAIIVHIRNRDFRRYLFINATSMLAICVGTLLWSFVL